MPNPFRFLKSHHHPHRNSLAETADADENSPAAAAAAAAARRGLFSFGRRSNILQGWNKKKRPPVDDYCSCEEEEEEDDSNSSGSMILSEDNDDEADDEYHHDENNPASFDFSSIHKGTIEDELGGGSTCEFSSLSSRSSSSEASHHMGGSPTAMDTKKNSGNNKTTTTNNNNNKRQKLPIMMIGAPTATTTTTTEAEDQNPQKQAEDQDPQKRPLFVISKEDRASFSRPGQSPFSSKPRAGGSSSSSSSAAVALRFHSILDRPFAYWHQLSTILKNVYPAWTPYQRGRIIHHLIHFLELKIGKDEYVPTGLIQPTRVVEQAWRFLVMEEPSLYVQIIHALQDFHQKPRIIMDDSSAFFVAATNNRPRNLTTVPSNNKEIEDKIRRTQSLFLLYFKEIMPSTIDDEAREPLSSPPPFSQRIGAGSSSRSTTTSTPMPKNPTFHFSTSPSNASHEDSLVLELASLSIKQYGAGGTSSNNGLLSPREDGTAETVATSSSSDDRSLMGLELL